MSSKDLSTYSLPKNINTEAFRFGIIVSEWNEEITQNLLKGAQDTLLENGVKPDNIRIDYVPGSFELIYGTHNLCKDDIFDAVIAIGCVIRGETPHFDYVCQAVSLGLKDINILTKTPAIFCVLTDDTLQQSIDRSGGKYGNKGVEAAVAAIKMAVFRKINL